MTLQAKLRTLYEPFTELDCPVYHYHRAEPSDRYVIWAEDGEESSFHADSRKAEQQLTGVVDLFTKDEFDSLADDIQEILDAEVAGGSGGWRLESVLYEEETNFIHYHWRWYVG